jgi:hypothetical protein
MTRCKDLIESPPLPELIELKMLCTIWGSRSGGYEQYHLLAHNAT